MEIINFTNACLSWRESEKTKYKTNPMHNNRYLERNISYFYFLILIFIQGVFSSWINKFYTFQIIGLFMICLIKLALAYLSILRLYIYISLYSLISCILSWRITLTPGSSVCKYKSKENLQIFCKFSRSACLTQFSLLRKSPGVMIRNEAYKVKKVCTKSRPK